MPVVLPLGCWPKVEGAPKAEPLVFAVLPKPPPVPKPLVPAGLAAAALPNPVVPLLAKAAKPEEDEEPVSEPVLVVLTVLDVPLDVEKDEGGAYEVCGRGCWCWWCVCGRGIGLGGARAFEVGVAAAVAEVAAVRGVVEAGGPAWLSCS